MSLETQHSGEQISMPWCGDTCHTWLRICTNIMGKVYLDSTNYLARAITQGASIRDVHKPCSGNIPMPVSSARMENCEWWMSRLFLCNTIKAQVDRNSWCLLGYWPRSSGGISSFTLWLASPRLHEQSMSRPLSSGLTHPQHHEWWVISVRSQIYQGPNLFPGIRIDLKDHHYNRELLKTSLCQQAT